MAKIEIYTTPWCGYCARAKALLERRRIARDLHDTVIQRLFAVGLSLQGALVAARSEPALTDRIERAVDEIDGTIRDIRTAIFSLHADRGSIRGFPLVVELGPERRRELAGQSTRVVARRPGQSAREVAQSAEHREIGLDPLDDPGASYLHHLAAVGEMGRMHLGDRRRGDRDGIELGEGFLHRSSQPRRDLCLDHRCIHDRTTVLEPSQLDLVGG